MAELEFTDEDVKLLAAQLATVRLGERERTLLLAIFSAASGRITDTAEIKLTPKNFQKQLVDAFIPGAVETFTICPYRIIPPPLRPRKKTK